MRTIIHHAQRRISVEIQCPQCHEEAWVEMSVDQHNEWYFNNFRRHVQEVFDGHSEADRERLLTGICPPCWKDMFEWDGDE